MKKGILVGIIIGVLCAALGFLGGYFLTKDDNEVVSKEHDTSSDCTDGFGNIKFSKEIPNEVLDLLAIELKDGKYTSSYNGFNDALNDSYSFELGDFDDEYLLDMIVKYYGTAKENNSEEHYNILSMTKEELAPYVEKYNIDENLITNDSLEYKNALVSGGYFARVEHNFYIINQSDSSLELADVRVIVNEAGESVDNIEGVKYTFAIDNGIYTLVSVN